MPWQPGLWALAGLVVLQSLWRAAADSVDVNVQLFRDANCYERVDQMVLLDQGCYANRYDNRTKAFMLKILVFDGADQQIELTQYVNYCDPVSLYSPGRSLRVGRCALFVGGFYAQVALRLRSLTCEGVSCSPISVATQQFFQDADCIGVVTETFTYPLQGECMRFYNGTQVFTMSDYGRTITEVDYNGNGGCAGNDVRTYVMPSGTCYPVTDGQAGSFLWMVEKGTNVLSATSGAIRLGSRKVFLIAGLPALARVAPLGKA